MFRDQFLGVAVPGWARPAASGMPARPVPGLLESVEPLARASAPLVVLLFSLHCTAPSAHSGRSASLDSRAEASDAYLETGSASWYGGGGDGFAGRPTANGETFDPSELTCAHRTLPFGTLVEVENLDNGRRLVLRVNDRGPFVRGRILDVSRQGAERLGMMGPGTARIRLRSVDAQGRPAPLESDREARNPFTLQVAALSDPENLKRLTRDLEARVGPVTLQDACTREGKAVKRVRVGSYDTFEGALLAAENVARIFKDRGVDPFITRQR